MEAKAGRIRELETAVSRLNTEIELLRNEIYTEHRVFRKELNDLLEAERRRQPYQPFSPVPVIGPGFVQPSMPPLDWYKVTCNAERSSQ
jgi:hypothetical protein